MRRGNTGLYALLSTVLLVVCEEAHQSIKSFEELEIQLPRLVNPTSK